jgi:hypothetical protein
MSKRHTSALLLRGGAARLGLGSCQGLVAAGWCLPPLASLATTPNPSFEKEGGQ